MSFRALETGPRSRIILLACALGLSLVGCTVVGPDAIRSGRLAYNEAITETNNQQLLMVLVHNRYEETNHLLGVASVTANVRISSSAQIQAGVGDSDNFEGNLVPFSGGFLYEENPTISYLPVSGEAYLHQLMSPVPLSLVAQVTRSLPHPRYAYNMLFASVNGIRNPAFLFGSQEDDPRFERLVNLMIELTHDHSLYWEYESGQADGVFLVIELSTPQSARRADELLALLKIPRPDSSNGRYVIPVTTARYEAGTEGIAITTRTIWELVELLSAAVQVPAHDKASGVAAELPAAGAVGRQLTIHYSESMPEQAYVAVEHHDGWFFIDASDLATKRYFKLMTSLWSAAMARSLDAKTSAPVLTVPVSR